MSCQIKLTACITDIPAIRRYLFPTDDNRGTDAWLQQCKVSVCPTADNIVFANDKRLVVLSGRWDSSTKTTQFQTSFEGCLHENDPIRAVLCLPVVTISQSSQVSPDWTCIVIGYESGYVRFYTENCTFLFEEQLHDEPITMLKCQSQHSPRPDIRPDLKAEKLFVVYNSNLCVIDGPHLFKILRNSRAQIAKGTPGSFDASLYSLNPKKWGFTEQETINDVEVAGLDLCHTFDHLYTASTNGGFDTKYRAMAPRNNLVLASGTKPFVGFHYALEGASQPLLSDVAKTMKSILKTALPFKGWLGGKSNNENSVIIQPVDPMGCRFGLCDYRRSALSIILSPDQKLAACTDALGRVILIDIHKGIAVRMFKGCREAQCAFIQVPEEGKSKRSLNRRIALFLIVYSQKKGLLEIYSAQQGNKIATFTASKNSRLFYITYSLMGFETTSKTKYICNFTCVLMDNDGLMKEFVVPFHYALTEKNSKRAKDLHLYKRLKQMLKSGDFDEEKLINESYNTTIELKTTEIKLQCLEMLMGNKEISPQALLKCADYHIEKINSLEAEEVDQEIQTLKTLSTNLNSLSTFYKQTVLNELDIDEENGNKICEEPKISIGAKEMSHLQKLLDLSTLNNTTEKCAKVSFTDNVKNSFAEFLAIFDISKPECIVLKKDVEEAVLFKIAEMIFERLIKEGLTNLVQFQEQVKSSNVILKDFFKLLLTYWVNRSLNININLEKEMNNLSTVIYALSLTGKKEELIADYNDISIFWYEIREILADSSHPFSALMAAILCKFVAQKIEYEQDMEQSNTSLEDTEIFEQVSSESCQWTMLIGKLEDISLLNTILSNKPIINKSILPVLKQDKLIISLKHVMEVGKGSVSELVAQWLTSGGISPELLILNEQYLLKQEKQGSVSSAEVDNSYSGEIEFSDEDLKLLQQPVIEHLNLLKQQFPYSLEVSVLLSNITFEYTKHWQKDIREMEKLETAFKCLNSIPNLHLRKGMYNLVWNTCLKIIFESSCKLINKVGKLPKERLCLQDTGLTDLQILEFLKLCTKFFDSFMDTLEDLFQGNPAKVALKFEPIFENGPPPLVEIAMLQGDINYQLLHLHYQLSLCFLMVGTFQVKTSKLMQNMFEYAVSDLFFTDLQNKAQINVNKNDAKLNLTRTQFLIKVILASIETVHLTDNGVYSIEHVKWMSECLSLARVWGLDVDLLKRFQVVSLFNSGFDSLAEELLPAINEPNKVGLDLLVICARRLSQVLAATEDLGEWITVLSPAVTSYIERAGKDWCAPSNLKGILTLVTHCLQCLNDSQAEYKTACLMMDACKTLHDLKS